MYLTQIMRIKFPNICIDDVNIHHNPSLDEVVSQITR
jgi:hypothetical protein